MKTSIKMIIFCCTESYCTKKWVVKDPLVPSDAVYLHIRTTADISNFILNTQLNIHYRCTKQHIGVALLH